MQSLFPELECLAKSVCVCVISVHVGAHVSFLLSSPWNSQLFYYKAAFEDSEQKFVIKLRGLLSQKGSESCC